MSAVSSMTGFSSVQGTVADVSFTVTVKSVNHRSLDLALRVPAGMEGLEAALRRMAKERIRRGHVEIGLLLDRAISGAKAELNEEVLNIYVAAFRQAASLHGLSGQPNVHELLRMPGVLSNETRSHQCDGPDLKTAVIAAATEAVTRLQEVRAIEGEALAATLCASLEKMEELTVEITRWSLGVTESHADRLRVRLTSLLNGSQISEDRIVTEAALLADRGDVEEELVRLRTHTTRFRNLLNAGGEVGRQLDFLLQELNREVNTLLSKTGASAGEAGLRITELGLQIKLELERAREQVQNLE